MDFNDTPEEAEYRAKVRAWEKANLGQPRPAPQPTPASGDRLPGE